MLRELLRARQYADSLGRSVWDFAVEIRSLHRAGVTNSDLRWLVCRGCLEHGQEIASPTGEGRAFRPGSPLRFTRRSCFVLTELGVELLRPAVARPGRLHRTFKLPGGDVSTNGAHGGRDGQGAVPRWDHERQELRLGDLLVKQFKVPAPNQEQILAVFEEEGWPRRIDDPLPPQADQDPKRRLHDTIVSLNRNQKSRLVRFLGDGSGQGVRWELVTTNGDL